LNYKVWRGLSFELQVKVGFFCEITGFCGLFLGNYKFWRVFFRNIIVHCLAESFETKWFFSSFFVVTSRIFSLSKNSRFSSSFFLENSSFRLRVIYFATPFSSAFVTLACANLFIGIITTVTTFVLENFDDEELKAIGSVLKVQYSRGPKCTSRKPKNKRDKNIPKLLRFFRQNFLQNF
jgi:hypothetical protein